MSTNNTLLILCSNFVLNKNTKKVTLLANQLKESYFWGNRRDRQFLGENREGVCTMIREYFIYTGIIETLRQNSG